MKLRFSILHTLTDQLQAGLYAGVLCLGLSACGGGGISSNGIPENSNPSIGQSADQDIPLGPNNPSVSNAVLPRSNVAPGLYFVAGNTGMMQDIDGQGSAARFGSPQDIAIDKSGNIYVADTGNQIIRKITATGAVTTFAGTLGVSGSADGTGQYAKFNSPTGITIAPDGNLYVVDSRNHTIRRITPEGSVTTFAGSPRISGGEDGIGTTARFDRPGSITADKTGNLFVTDTSSFTIRKITASGVVTTLAGSPGQTVCLARGCDQSSASIDGIGAAARFGTFKDIEIGPDGNLYVLDWSNPGLRRVTPAGNVTSLTEGGSALGAASSLAVDAQGNLFATTFSHTIRMLTLAGAASTLAGTTEVLGNADGVRNAATFNYPHGLAVDATGNVIVADTNNHLIRKITPEGAVTNLAGSKEPSTYTSIFTMTNGADGIGALANFNRPNGTLADNKGNIFITDTNSHTIRKITPDGLVTTLAGTALTPGNVNASGAAARFTNPGSPSIDAAGNLYVMDSWGMHKITPEGVVSKFPDYEGRLLFDTVGNMYVATISAIFKVTPSGSRRLLAGGTIGSADGQGAAAQFNGAASGMAADMAGNLYVSDFSNHTIRKITPDGMVTTLAGKAGVAGYVDGAGNAARFNSPVGIALDGKGNVYTVEADNQVIRKITPAGEVSTIAGVAMQFGTLTGNLPGSFAWPSGISTFNSNTLVVTSGNGVLKVVLPE